MVLQSEKEGERKENEWNGIMGIGYTEIAEVFFFPRSTRLSCFI